MNTKSTRPLYIMVANQLRKNIASGRYTERIPSETELAREFSVCRNTIREALSVLRDEGLLIRKHGVGTFISAERISVGLGRERIESFTETVHKSGHTPGTAYISFDWEPAGLDMTHTLGVPVGSIVGVLKRVRTTDGEPTFYQIEKLPVDIIGDDYKPETMGESLFTYLSEVRDIVFDRSDVSLRAAVPNAKLAQMLKMDPGFPFLLIEETYHSPNNKPVLWSANYYRSDIYRFRLSHDKEQFWLQTKNN